MPAGLRQRRGAQRLELTGTSKLVENSIRCPPLGGDGCFEAPSRPTALQHQRLAFALRRTRSTAAPRAASQSGKHRGQAGLLNDQNHVRRGAGSKPIERRRHWVASLVVGILVALLIAVGMFLLLVSNEAALSRTPPGPDITDHGEQMSRLPSVLGACCSNHRLRPRPTRRG